ncbi:efflux RND transporter periplasmic adaptor subunit [Effusibacillus dendaii]|uniref:RND transporter n=1 Tax=Effusibacillus dendaii TaxID=2743772 RepID=A0A7I8DDP6_9BACL|nr:efflux RND transporter periplasmic adaptor subunit [Effusibacillus dendaii]BCJ88333.1 RND transporter [Effusibacillus dendaii]
MAFAKKIFLFLVIPIGVFLAVLTGAFSSKIAPGMTEPVTQKVSGIKWEEAQKVAAKNGVTLPGTIVADKEAKVASRILASVKQILVAKGDRVKKGDPLILLDSAQVGAYSNLAEAAVQEAVAAKSQSEQSVKQAMANVQSAEAKFQNVESSYRRMLNLYQNGAVSKQDFEDTQMAYQQAQAQLDQAQAALKAEQAMQQAVSAKMDQAQASYGAAVDNLNQATITAPFDGVVTNKLVETGDMASPGSPLIVIEKEPYLLEVYADERLAKSIRTGDKVPVTIDALQSELTGEVTEITPRVDPASRTFTVKIQIPKDDRVVPGMFGKVIFPDGTSNVMMVPVSSIVKWSQFTGVYVVDSKNKAHLRYVSLGKQQGDRIEVLSGLNPQDQIVIEGTDRLADGVEVTN